MNKLIIAALLAGSVTTANAGFDLTSCAATYTVAAAAFANVGENRNADGAAYLAGQTRVLSIQKNWGGNTQAASSMYKQSLQVQQGRFRSQGWPVLSRDLDECSRVLKQYNIQ